MKPFKLFTLFIIIIIMSNVNLIAFININNLQGTAVVTIDSIIHNDYGFSYPLTYKISIPQNLENNIQFFMNHTNENPFALLTEKKSDDFFNGIEAYRIDRENNKAYVSVSFREETDSIFLRACNTKGELLSISIDGICPYYDNRPGAVTSSADDMAGWSMRKFKNSIQKFRFYQLYLTCGINTGGCNTNAYSDIQDELDMGYVEAASHTRNHPGWNDYNDYDSEITGCKNDIVNHLDLPSKYRNGDREYVYIFIAPNGYRDEIIDSLVAENKHLVNRLYYSDYYGISDWDHTLGVYNPIGVTRAIDPPASRLGWGIGSDDIEDLNGAFDEAFANNNVYHVMCHPNVVEWDSAYTKEHLAYISGRKDVWYASLGHIYLYHYGSSNYSTSVPATEAQRRPENSFQLTNLSAYPNPFKDHLTISYHLKEPSKITIDIYNIMGEKVESFPTQDKSPGEHKFTWHPCEIATGCYYISVKTPHRHHYRKTLHIK